MKSDIQTYKKQCEVCQRAKGENTKPFGLLQPLPIPTRPWSSISMDFIEGLLKSNQYSVIMVVVDMFTKYAHFIPVSHPYNVTKIANLFSQNVMKLHRLPNNIVSDRPGSYLHQKVLGRVISNSRGQAVDVYSIAPPNRQADRGNQQNIGRVPKVLCG